MSEHRFLDLQGRPRAPLDPADRGLAYGDGVFETLLAVDGEPVWWDGHWQRLLRGCELLGLPAPQAGPVHDQARALAGAGRCVVKLVLTRGPGGRGYAPPDQPDPCLLLSRHDAPPAWPSEGVAMRSCSTRMAIQPRLAGIKHLNRLEQVLARSEWADPAIHEGLLSDMDGRPVSATAANLLVRRGDRWLTPPVDRCGIAGICRAWLLAEGLVEEARLESADIERAEALALASSVRGIAAVRSLDGRALPGVAAVAPLVRALDEAVPAFAAGAGAARA